MKKIFGVHPYQGGFSLIEVVTAMAILVAVIIGCLSANLHLKKAGETSHERTVALQDANRVCEKLRIKAAAVSNFPADVISQYPNNQPVEGFTSLPNQTVLLDYADTNADPLDAVVTVSWTSSQGRSETVRVRSFITKRG
jgi:prepilin-type N-terminal cleavage/methylation domain-containing protein